jgi:hypothetical protein
MKFYIRTAVITTDVYQIKHPHRVVTFTEDRWHCVKYLHNDTVNSCTKILNTQSCPMR